ncbi:FeoA family protein [Desulfotomaculum nigrificans]|uniref:FeoA family protein n=1 Tax=Desulfotomaculum nigrificans TaxID=1565 RepID=UPI0001FAE562|nr:FeoA family protein [Desulfotomaculum nigrificans]MDA8235922.1 FeoA family protein [Clostridia bacterium]
MSIGRAETISKVMSQVAVNKNSMLLLDAEVGKGGTITGIHTKDDNILKKIMAMGVLPGMPVKVIQKSPSVVFKVGNTTLAVDHNIAQCIEILA